MPSVLSYLTRVLKMPTIGAFWEELADQARDQNWSHEEYLAALVQRQVADRESKGSTMRIRTAHFPQVKTLEDFNLDLTLGRDLLRRCRRGRDDRPPGPLRRGPPSYRRLLPPPPATEAPGEGKPVRPDLLSRIGGRRRQRDPHGRRRRRW
ncbi:ATP-binding protein [Streptomyces sp. NPDC002159]